MNLEMYEKYHSAPKFPFIEYDCIWTTNHKGPKRKAYVIKEVRKVNLLDRLFFLRRVMAMKMDMGSDNVWQTYFKSCFDEIAGKDKISDKNIAQMITHYQNTGEDLSLSSPVGQRSMQVYLDKLVDMIKQNFPRAYIEIEGDDPYPLYIDDEEKLKSIKNHIGERYSSEQAEQYAGRMYEVFRFDGRYLDGNNLETWGIDQYYGMVLRYDEERKKKTKRETDWEDYLLSLEKEREFLYNSSTDPFEAIDI